MQRLMILSAAVIGLMFLISCGDGDNPIPSDTTPPTIVAVDPDDGADNVHVGTAITVTFSEDIDQSSINDTTFIVEGVAGTIAYGSRTATFTPDADLDVTTTYTIVITTGVADIAGNHLAGTFISSFTTGDVFITSGSQYFPMADGDTWYYTDGSARNIIRTVSGDTVINGLRCQRVLENDTTAEAWSKDSTGFYVHLLDQILWFDPPLKIPFNLALEEPYDYASTAYWTENDTTYFVDISGTLKFKGYETYSVTAGVFDSCLHFLYLTEGYNEYYARSVGLLDNDDYVLDSAFVGGVWYRP